VPPWPRNARASAPGRSERTLDDRRYIPRDESVGGAQAELNPREAAVLNTIVQEYVVRGEPVGSQRVAKLSELGLSAASIRNVMARLEDLGLLASPHRSAGRVPTDLGYRRFVDHLAHRAARVTPVQAQRIEDALARSHGDVPELLGEATRQLSTLSHQVGIVLAPELRRVIVDRLEFIRLDDHRVAVILVARSGVVHHRILAVPEPEEQVELERIGRYLSETFGGRTLPHMREALRRRMQVDRETIDRLQARSLELCSMTVDAENVETEVFVEGVSNLLESPDFADLDVVRAMFKTLEEKQTLVNLLGRLIEGEGVQVMIGAENRLADLSNCSVVAATYGSRGQVMGSVGVVGPKRMQYGRVIPLVGYLARVLSGLLSPRT